MTTRDDSFLVCRHCNRKFVRASGKGRPPTYCGPACRSAAYRRRTRTTADTRPAPDPQVARIGEDLVAQVRRLGRLARATDTGSTLEMLRQLNLLQRELADFTAAAVQRARTGGAGWNVIGESLHVSGDTARTRWSAGQVERRLNNRTKRAPARPAPRRNNPGGREPRPSQSSARPSQNGPDTEAGRGSPRRGTSLSLALSGLHRGSGKSLRGLARDAGISASFASRVLNGDRLPSWPITEALAVACGADPSGVRSVWEDARTSSVSRTALRGPRPLGQRLPGLPGGPAEGPETPSALVSAASRVPGVPGRTAGTRATADVTYEHAYALARFACDLRSGRRDGPGCAAPAVTPSVPWPGPPPAASGAERERTALPAAAFG